MKIVGLKGFSSLGGIDQHFVMNEDLWFPEQCNWSRRDAGPLMSEYTKRYQEQPCILICYSDGGSVGHLWAQSDSRVQAIIAHSATCPLKADELVRDIPMLLIRNDWDWTGMGWRTDRTAAWLRKNGMTKVDRHTVVSNHWSGHDFASGLVLMATWIWFKFDYVLPLRIDRNV